MRLQLVITRLVFLKQGPRDPASAEHRLGRCIASILQSVEIGEPNP